MRNRKRSNHLLLIVIVVLTIFWIVRKNSSSSSSLVVPTPAESTQTELEPAGVSAKSSSLSTPHSITESSDVRVGPGDIYPDSRFTPGVTNPDIVQGNIQETICNPRWSTKSIRPPTTYTSHLKAEQISEYGYDDADPRDYEEDHLIPLELGGNPTDPRNLWPEPWVTSIPDGGARFKDHVENYLHSQVCSGNLTLEEAQREIADDWYRVYTISIRR